MRDALSLARCAVTVYDSRDDAHAISGDDDAFGVNHWDWGRETGYRSTQMTRPGFPHH